MTSALCADLCADTAHAGVPAPNRGVEYAAR